jgi:hypothetical protein
VEIGEFGLGKETLDKLKTLLFDVREVSFKSLSLRLPAWRKPLQVDVRGLKIVLQQCRMPTVRSHIDQLSDWIIFAVDPHLKQWLL